MNKLTLLFFPLMLASLACMETVSTIKSNPTTQPTQTEIASGAVFDVSIWTVTPETFCAIVTASNSLHLRSAPQANAPIIGYLTAGERVTLGAGTGGAWWKIATAAGLHGWSNSNYLEAVPCLP